MVIAKQIHNMLKTIAEKTFPNVDISGFWVSVIPKETSRHGDYSPLNKKIRIFNLSEKPEYIISTTIHELAHHCEFCIYKSTAHKRRFYEVFRALLITAIQMGYVTYETIRTQETANDIATLERYFGRINVKYDESKDISKDKFIIKVINSYSIKSILQKRDYTYDGVEQSWITEIDGENNLEQEKEYLYSIIDKKNVKVHNAKEIKVEAIYYIVVGNCYDYKDILKNNGYIFNGYNYKNNQWVKKIKAADLNKEKLFLSRMKNIKVKIDGTK